MKHRLDNRYAFDPTEEDLKNPQFEAIWQIIKTWDIKTSFDCGYQGANGNDVMMILQSLRELK